MTAQRTRNTRETIVPKHGDRKWKPRFIAAVFVAVIAIGASACSTASADNPATVKDQTTTTIGLLPPGESTISNALIESGEFPTLVAEVLDDAMFESAYGQTPLTFTSAGGDVLMVDGATIIGDETAVVNGFIHTIDAVLVLTPGQ
jgi:hypothetical protein